MRINARQQQILQHLWREGGLSRWELHKRTGLTPNGVGQIVSDLIDQGIISEGTPQPVRAGRPRIPLEIDTHQRHIACVALRRGQVSVCRLNLKGQLIGKLTVQKVQSSDQVIPTACQLLTSVIDATTLFVSVNVTGLIDPEAQTILFSSAVQGRGTISLTPITQAAGNLPVLFDNDMHALAARWVLTHQAELDQDLLLVSINDGAIGSAMLVDGKPNRGCVLSANELGHTRLPVDTEQCYCGHKGCLERIVSTTYLHQLNPSQSVATLLEQAAIFENDNPALETVIDHLAMSLSNAVNFIRPNRLILVSELTRYPNFTDTLLRKLRGSVLMNIVDRFKIDLWDQPAARNAETAGWLGLTRLYCNDWGGIVTHQNHTVLS
ncbi:N-acetylglucosamine repressor [Poriferisphaera corsica]|uniref:N-acetylglucosamine repressor n=1 Tax=Poriferisphaera corsica TaxID=2528020 RepID=A0A517YW34_9BACT|nr:ROK family transcriptional regulator [Poriferisphaera corsica]QDU34441.1 N-acetylglucosamine repressor [Poriferisphaera corsica]